MRPVALATADQVHRADYQGVGSGQRVRGDQQRPRAHDGHLHPTD